MNPETQRQKLVTFGQDPQLAIFDELQELNTNIQGLSQFAEGATTVLVDKVRSSEDLNRMIAQMAQVNESFNNIAKKGWQVSQLDVKNIEKELKKLNAKDDKKEYNAIIKALNELIALEKENEKVSVTVKIV